MPFRTLKGHTGYTVCLSTQAGCPVGCPFCATGQQGFERNLTPGEIIEQLLHFARRLTALVDALHRVSAPFDLHFAVHTARPVHRVPGLRVGIRTRRRGGEVRVAQSLFAADEGRARAVPVERRRAEEMFNSVQADSLPGWPKCRCTSFCRPSGWANSQSTWF